MAQTTVSELLDFTGGMNTLVAPHLVSPREATALINVDVRLGSLASVPNLEYREDLTYGGHFYEFEGVVYSYPTYRDNVFWDGKWYWSDGIEVKKVLSDGTEMDLGIKTPDKFADIYLVVDAEGPHTGAFKYCYTFYSTLTGVESAPSPLQNEYLVAEADKIAISNMEALPANADTYRIYRIGGYLPTFTLVDSTDINSYIDDRGDTRIDGRHLTTMYCGVPPDGLENLTEFNGRFYGSVGNKVYYSALGNPDAWYVSDYFIARDTIIGIANSPGGILVLGKYFTMLMYGTQPTDYKIKLLSDQLGCLDKRSISYIGDSAIWLSTRAFVMCNGYTVTNVTAHKIDSLRGIIPTGCVVDDDTYYMSFRPQLVPQNDLYPDEKLYPALIEGTAGLTDGIIAMDFKRGNGYSYKLLHYNKIWSLGIIRGEVHVGTGADYQSWTRCEEAMFRQCGDFLACTGFSVNRLSVYNGQGLAKLEYLSPRLIDGSIATMKEYDKVRIVFKGIFTFKVIFDNGEVVVQETTTSQANEDGFIIIGIPNKNNKSQFIRFHVEGVGVVSSIQYSFKTRELVN